MIYCLKEYPTDREPIETINLKDIDGNNWQIKRYDEGYGMVIHYEGDTGKMPEYFVYTAEDQIMSMINSNFIHYEEDSFEEFMLLRNWIISADAEECFILIEDLFQQRFRINPHLIMECETVF